MTNNEKNNRKIAEWAGLDYAYYAAHIDEIPDFENSNAAAIELLDVLVEKGYEVGLVRSTETQSHWVFMTGKINPDKSIIDAEATAPTKSAAITTAILQLIEKGER